MVGPKISPITENSKYSESNTTSLGIAALSVSFIGSLAVISPALLGRTMKDKLLPLFEGTVTILTRFLSFKTNSSISLETSVKSYSLSVFSMVTSASKALSISNGLLTTNSRIFLGTSILYLERCKFTAIVLFCLLPVCSSVMTANILMGALFLLVSISTVNLGKTYLATSNFFSVLVSSSLGPCITSINHSPITGCSDN
ncbi:hypothetical protein FF38_00380 [Lucilia cuprina]|uniref:Uncharacterized protein n=1 Tax=Lucilia cuprina TaxID=7375 RepID=A0A0L0BSC9_LUCCU|nr:hypothetical protein FF38_00380 [Lucilia cuprina]